MGFVRINPELASLLARAVTQREQMEVLKAALTSNRRVKAKRLSGSPSQSQVWADGVLFRDAALTGEIELEGTKITSYGDTSDLVTCLAADLSTGLSVLRIEGGGHWLEGTLGLPGSNCNFVLDSNPTTSNGLAVNPNFDIRPDPALPVHYLGKGAPYSVTLEDAEGNESTIYFDEDAGGIVWDDADRTSVLGVTPYMRSSQTLKIGTGGDAFQYGIHCFKLPEICNDEDPSKPVYEFLGLPGPYGRAWQHPFMTGFDPAYDTTIPPACRITVREIDGTIWKVFQGRDNGLFNDPSWSQIRNETNAFRPFFHMKSCLYHSSHRLALSPHARKYNNGVIASMGMRPKMARSMVSSNAVFLSFGTGGTQYNGYNFMLGSPPDGLNTTARVSNGGAPPITDQYLPTTLERDDSGNGHDGARNPAYAMGWKCSEPGALAHQDPYPGPGGQRFDRGYAPSHMLYYLTDPDGVRPQGSVPWKTICHEYFKGGFHLGHHEWTDVRLAQGLPFELAGYGLVAYCRGYYTPQGPIFVPGGESRHIDAMTLTTSGSPAPRDKYGRLFYGGSNMDYMHAYSTPYWYAVMFNSVAAAFSGLHRTYGMLMSSGGSWGTPTANPLSFMLARQHAWRLHQLGFAWKMGSQHPSLVTRAAWETRMMAEQDYFYDRVTVPFTDPAHAEHNSLFNQGLRNLGVPVERIVSGSNHYLRCTTDAKLLYMFGVLTTGKHLGWVEALTEKSEKASSNFALLLESVRKYSVDRLIETNGRGEGLQERLTDTVPTTEALTVPSGWAAWVNKFAPVNGAEDLITNANGSRYVSSGGNLERSGYQHLWMQAVFGWRDHWAGIVTTRVEEACVVAQGFEDRFAALVAAGGGDYAYRHPTDAPMAPVQQ